jgi:hypothetical protein
MALPELLEEAAARLDEAAYRISEARTQAPTIPVLHEWLSAVTDYCLALSDVQRLTNQSIHEKLHAIAGRLGIESVL